MADRFRQRRFARLRRLVNALPRPVRILDIGGTVSFWERVGYAGDDGVEIVLLNRIEQAPQHSNMAATVGDALDLSRYDDDAFDIAISNSLIEHLGTLDLQMQSAVEMRRVAARVYLQTPNRYFPLEPHFLFPFFAILPIRIRAFLLEHMDLGWHKRRRDPTEALADVQSIRLMTGSELRRLFPGARFANERFLGLTKSFIVLDGWEASEV